MLRVLRFGNGQGAGDCRNFRIRMGDGAAGEMEELARYKCLGDDGSNVVVVEYRYVHNSHAENGSPRRYPGARHLILRSEEHTSELQSLMRNSYADFCLKKKT